MDPAEIQRRFDDAARRDANVHAPFLGEAAALLLERLAGLPDAPTLLDLGTGAGDMIALASPKLREGEAIGVDLSQVNLETARTRFHQAPFRSRFLHQNAVAVDLPDQSADAVSLNFLLPYSDDPVRILREAARIARTGAPVAASAAARPFLGQPWDRLLAAIRRRNAEYPDINDRFTHRSLAEIALFADLRDIVIQEIQREFWWPTPGSWLQMLRALGLIPAWDDQIDHGISQTVASDDRIVDPDGQVRCRMTLLILSATAP